VIKPDLCEAAAENLAGRPLLLRFRQPPAVGALGEFYKSDSGVLCIDIAPGLPPLQLLAVLAHEAAHARLHAAYAPVTTLAQQRGGIVLARGGNMALFEDPAEALARSWLERAARLAAPHLAEGDTDEYRAKIILIQLKYLRSCDEKNC
jgi:hypothetical protein